MTPHYRLHSCTLAVLLQQWQQADLGAPPSDMAEHMGQWLGTVDAVQLGRSLHAIEALGQEPAAGSGQVLDVAALAHAVQGAREALVAAVCAGPPAPRLARERADNTVDEPDLTEQADFSFHAPRYLALQKQMDTRLVALRTQLRQGLARGTTELRQLAALDAAMEQRLAAREERLWSSLPVHLDRRFLQLREGHLQRLRLLGQEDEPREWRLPGGWLHTFELDLQALLLAEMHARLQPALGLLEAARHQNMETQE